MSYIVRSLEPVLLRAAAEFPAVVLTGPRQSGKTTLLLHCFGRTHGYVSLEPPDVRSAAAADPRGFLDLHPAPVILDEVQYAPDLLPYIKERIDQRRMDRGRFVLTGSQDLLVAERVTESLAGRAAVLRLLPLSHREAERRPDASLPWEAASRTTSPARRGGLWLDILRGGYPELVTEPQRDLNLWHSSYIQTYLERDVRSIRQVGDLAVFQSFIRALAARSGQLLNLADLSRDLGVALNTVKAWLSVLEATYQVFVLRPYHANTGKRLVKTPKVYFADTGTLCHLVGLRDPEHAAAGPMAGALFETAVVVEVLRTLVHRGEEPRLHFWRTSTGSEVDLVIDAGEALIPIEMKLSSTPRTQMAEGITSLRAALGDLVGPGYVVHQGDIRLSLAPGVTAVPIGDLWR